jgi:hypothetical protein
VTNLLNTVVNTWVVAWKMLWRRLGERGSRSDDCCVGAGSGNRWGSPLIELKYNGGDCGSFLLPSATWIIVGGVDLSSV